MSSHPVPRSFLGRSRAGGFISSPRSFPSRSRATSFYIQLVPRSFTSRSRARSLHPFGPIWYQQKQSQVLCPVQDPFSPEVEPGVSTSSWSRSFPSRCSGGVVIRLTDPHGFPHPVGPGSSCSSGFRSPFEEPWVYIQLVKILSLQIWRNAYAVVAADGKHEVNI